MNGVTECDDKPQSVQRRFAVIFALFLRQFGIWDKASLVNEQASGKNYVLVFVTVENEMKDAVIVRKGDYSLTVNGEEIASEGYVTKVDLQSGTPGSNRLYTSDYETVPKKDTRTLGIIFFCDAEEGADYTLRFHDRVISQ